MSALYLDIYIYGLLFLFFYNIATGIFTAMGDSRTPFIFLAISSTANIGADILFVTAFGMGVDGVAWATFICQGVSSILAVGALIIRLRKIGEEKEKAPLFSWTILMQITKVAVPSILQQSFVSVGNILIQSVINSFGTAVMAGYSGFAAQNFGAGKLERVIKGRREGLLLSSVFSIIASLLFVFLGRYILLLFMNSDAEAALNEGMRFLRIVAPFYVMIGVKIITDAVIRGSGDMIPFMISTFSDLILRVALAFILAVGTLISCLFYRSGHWKKSKLI